MIDYHVLLGAVAALIGISGYVPYFMDLVKKKIKPHVFSWLIWTLSTGIVFFAQFVKGGGAGAWTLASYTILSFAVFLIALFRGEKEITLLDKGSLIGALFGMVLWFVTENPLYSVILLTTMDVLGYIPTTRKAWKKPNEEAVTVFALTGVGLGVSILALQALNPTTLIYPIALVITNAVFVTIVLKRRKDLGTKK